MPIRQLPAPCWVPSWDGDDRDDMSARERSGHFASREDLAAVFARANAPGVLAFHIGCGGVVMFGTGPWCQGCEEDLADGAYEIRPAVPRQLATACFTAECDGLPGHPCGEPLTDSDYDSPPHFDSEADAREFASGDWTVTPDGRWLCWDCAGGGDG